MQDKTKHRLVGALVLLSLGILFLPALLYRDDAVQEIVVRPQAPIPPAPPVEPIPPIVKPKPPTVAEPPEPLFEPKAPTVVAKDEEPEPASPRLTEKGVPEGWLIQVASLSLEKSAEVLVSRLKSDGYSAYWEVANTAQGERYRVFVGPQIDKSRAEAIKTAIDESYQVTSRLLRFNPAAGN